MKGILKAAFVVALVIYIPVVIGIGVHMTTKYY